MCLMNSNLFLLSLQLVHILNMISAKILTYSVADDETVADLQLRLERDTGIPAANQELLLEAGLALEPHVLASQCAVDYAVMSQTHTVMETMNMKGELQSSVSVGGGRTAERPSSGLLV